MRFKARFDAGLRVVAMSSNQFGSGRHRRRRYRVSAGPSRHNMQALKIAVAAAELDGD